jgi:hypothetical protein
MCVVHVSNEMLPSVFSPTHLSFPAETPLHFAFKSLLCIFHLPITKYGNYIEREIDIFRSY